ncbi:glycoside hydrolase family 16 protein [Exidia glandulosa HHB12029]|uniref:Glycoside hydrolase family 16 protein n=1 Tax=Exidia glandulosa HHB12029 TaxID=1314781 RepID=A0A165GP28_EXIGL|nr:glycoside hydrolase family 16 protein [Exidia glandulosa HHB12029]
MPRCPPSPPALAFHSLFHFAFDAAFRAAKQYKISSNVVGTKFYDFFNFYSAADPTHGRVQYVNKDTARKHNLTSTSAHSFVMRTDSKNKLSAGGPGRMSIRLESKKKYKTHVAVLDLRHMPQGAGTWPAYWMTGDNWPNLGELDIIENVNDASENVSSLHTSAGCTQPKSGRVMKGRVSNTDCNAFANGNAGCGVVTDSKRSFGPNFNKAGGGWFATERTDTKIKYWFWSRKDPHVPAEVRANKGTVHPEKWGKPTAVFNSQSCNISKKFGSHMFIINTSLCGDWAGNVYPGGMGACVKHVNENPGAFKSAYWDISRLSIYQ